LFAKTPADAKLAGFNIVTTTLLGEGDFETSQRRAALKKERQGQIADLPDLPTQFALYT
jgi:hypothetical protein